MAMHKVRVFSLFERIWHWSQAASIFILIFTGLAIHGTHDWIDYETAVTLHSIVAVALLVLWAFVTFWLFTTGELRHYIPNLSTQCQKTLLSVARYYAYGIFKGEHHPYRKTILRKHNPLQGVSYLMLKILVFPVIWITGILYLLSSLGVIELSAYLSIGMVAVIHTIATVVIIMFVIIHVYLLTTGHSFKEHLMPMINGRDRIDLTKEQYDYLVCNDPERLED